MNKNTKLAHLIEQEKLLYLEVEQLRYSLYLHDESILFQLLSAFYFAYSDVIAFFKRKKIKELSLIEEKKQSIDILQKRKNRYSALQRSPYAWTISSLRFLRRSMAALQFGLRKQKQDTLNPKKNIQKKSFIIYGSTESTDLQSRSVQIARTLAQHHEVLYVEGTFDEGIRSGFRITEDSVFFKSIRLTVYKSFHLNYQKPSPEEIRLLKLSLKLANPLTRSLVNPLPYVHHPFWSLILPLKKKSFYLDRTSDFAHEHTAAKHIEEAEKKLMKNALIVSAPHIKLLRNKKDIVLKNGVDWEFFKDTSKMIQTCDVGLCWIKKPVMGYIGTLDERMDEVLLGSIATAFPAASIVLVGNTDYRPVIEVAEKFPNIFPVGKQPYKKLPLFLQSFDILISPFKLNNNTRIEHPEFPLYLASGKPALHTSEVCKWQKQPYKQFVYYPKTHADWMIMIAEALKEKPHSRKKYLRIAMAKKLSWNTNKL